MTDDRSMRRSSMYRTYEKPVSDLQHEVSHVLLLSIMGQITKLDAHNRIMKLLRKAGQ